MTYVANKAQPPVSDYLTTIISISELAAAKCNAHIATKERRSFFLMSLSCRHLHSPDIQYESVYDTIQGT